MKTSEKDKNHVVSEVKSQKLPDRGHDSRDPDCEGSGYGSDGREKNLAGHGEGADPGRGDVSMKRAFAMAVVRLMLRLGLIS
jgi:hypothetical protein